VLATGLKWGCRGHTHFEHLTVYWVGSSLGALLSIKIWELPLVRRVMVDPFKQIGADAVPAEKKED